MVGLMTFGKKKYESLDDIMRKTIGALHGNLQTMLPLVDKDSEAFADYMVRERVCRGGCGLGRVCVSVCGGECVCVCECVWWGVCVCLSECVSVCVCVWWGVCVLE